MSLTHKDVKDILNLLDDSVFDEIHLETDGLKLTLRQSGAAGSAGLVPVGESQKSPAPAPAPPTTNEKAQPKEGSSSPSGKTEAGIVEVKAPMLGTFYSTPKPGEPPFVKAGDQIEEDSVLCIIEVMKLMNSVKAGTSGEIVEVCVADGDLVEFDQVLFRVKV